MTLFDPQRWSQVKSIVADALECEPAQREELIRRQCAGDEDLHAQVDRLLSVGAATDGTSHFLRPLTFDALSAAMGSADRPHDLVGRQIGRYRIISPIASGGMGTVFLAEQDHPHRNVALKIIQFGLLTHATRRRFEFEAQILARLRHPGIVQIYEAGTYDLSGPEATRGGGVSKGSPALRTGNDESRVTGRPFFAMELVEGESIIEYAQRHQLSVRHRLDLIISVCEAMHHAHSRGVIHRDLKPANLLVVESSDGSERHGMPKILDFGVARAVGADLHAASMHTAAGELVGSLRYMSPEQIAGDPDDIDVRCDVYALGVVCYELLAGRLPYEIKTGTAAEVSQLIVQEKRVPLSAADRSLRGDLQTILSKAIAKDKQIRYQSVADFAADLARFLHNQPIAARPPTTLYQMRKFAQRNRTLVGGVAATLLVLTIGLILYANEAYKARQEATNAHQSAQVATREKQRAQNEAQKSAAVSQFLTRLLAKIDPNSRGQNVNIAQLVDETAGEIDATFAEHPLSRAAVHDEVGTIYYNLGLYEHASGHYSSAYQARLGLLGPDNAETLAGHNSIGLAAMRLGRLDEAEQQFRVALDGRRRVLGDNDSQTLATMNNLAMLYQVRNEPGDQDQAQLLLEQALAGQRQALGPQHRDTLTTLTNLAGLLRMRGDLAGAEPLQRAALRGFSSTLGEDHASTLIAMSNLAGTLRRLDRPEEAQELFRRAVDGLRRTLGDEHSDTLVAAHNFGQLLMSRGRHADAEAQFRVAVAGFRKSAGAQPDSVLVALKNLGRALQAQNMTAQAQTAYLESLAGYQSMFGNDDRRTREVQSLLDSLPRNSEGQ